MYRPADLIEEWQHGRIPPTPEDNDILGARRAKLISECRGDLGVIGRACGDYIERKPINTAAGK